MKKFILILSCLLFVSTIEAQELKKLWEVSSLEAPESVVFHAEKNVYLVSNVAGQPAEKNKQGYISLLNEDGQIVQKKWAVGFNAPKGLGIYGKELYVADIDVVAVVDLNTGKIKKTYKAEGATFLNDVEIAENGTVYISDTFGGNAIYRIKDGEITQWVKNEALNYPNGLKIKGNDLYVASWGVVTNPETFGTEIPGMLLAINMENKTIRKITTPTGNLDGLEILGDRFLASDWIAGGLMTISETGVVKNIKDLNPGSADINFIEEKNILLVPQMLDGKLTAYELK